MKNGLKAAPQDPARVNEHLNKYINDKFKECYGKIEETVKFNKNERSLINFEKSNLIYEREEKKKECSWQLKC